MRKLMVAMTALALGTGACAQTIDGDTASASSNPAAIHERLLTLDAHIDTPMHFARQDWDFAERHSYQEDYSQVDLPRMEEGMLDGGFFVVYTRQGDLTTEGYAEAREAALTRRRLVLDVLAANRDRIELALTADDAARISGEGRLVAYISMENSYGLGEDISLLEDFYESGLRMAGAVHFADNQFSDSATGEGRWGGLSPLGRELVAEMNRLGIIVDGSHASDEAIDQMIELSATPIILSHHGPKAQLDHPRNLDDERLRRVAESGGVIAVNSTFLAPIAPTPEWERVNARFDSFFNEMTREEQRQFVADLQAVPYFTDSTFEMFVASLLHLIELVGVDHVAFGADWDGGGGVEGMRDIAGLPRVTARLIEEGYTEEDLEKMWSGNILRLLHAAETHATRIME